MRMKDLAAFAPGGGHDDAPAVLYWLHITVAVLTATLLVVAVTDMLVGVVLRPDVDVHAVLLADRAHPSALSTAASTAAGSNDSSFSPCTKTVGVPVTPWSKTAC